MVIDEIKERVSVAEILSLYGVEKVRGTNIYKCPFHYDKHPSASVLKGVDKFHCFVCNKNWDIFDIVREFEHCDLNTAIRIINDKMHLGLTRKLTKKEQFETFFLQMEKWRERELQKEKVEWQTEIRNKLTKKIRMYEKLELKLRPAKTEIELQSWEWEIADAYFAVIKELERLETLYAILYETSPPQNEYYFVYGIDKNKIYEQIKNKNIII